jgi:hypothetical protein
MKSCGKAYELVFPILFGIVKPNPYVFKGDTRCALSGRHGGTVGSNSVGESDGGAFSGADSDLPSVLDTDPSIFVSIQELCGACGFRHSRKRATDY